MPTNSESQHFIETYKSLITLSIEGFKFCALANGGAAVAILSYLGNVSAKGSAVADMRCPMAAFLAGLVPAQIYGRSRLGSCLFSASCARLHI